MGLDRGSLCFVSMLCRWHDLCWSWLLLDGPQGVSDVVDLASVFVDVFYHVLELGMCATMCAVMSFIRSVYGFGKTQKVVLVVLRIWEDRMSYRGGVTVLGRT